MRDFWDTREELSAIRSFAHSRMLSADAVLAATLARVAVLVPPTIQLPAIIGSRSPLSTYVGIVSASGGGKSSAWAAAGELIGTPAGAAAYAQVGMGSGEGIIEHLSATGDDDHREHENLLLEADEIGGLETLAGRTGATLAGVLKTGWSGGLLHNANRSASGKVEAGTYALGCYVGIQPKAAGWLLDATGDGFFQRFVFFRGNDDTVPVDAADTGERLSIAIPRPGDLDAGALHVESSIRKVIRADRLRAVRNVDLGVERIDSHRNLIRLRLAALLAILCKSFIVRWDDWQLAGTILERSDALADGMRAVVAESARDAAVAVASARLDVAERVEATTIGKASVRIVGLLTDKYDAASKVRKRLTNSLRGSFDDALDVLEASGQIEVKSTGDGRWIRRRAVTPSPRHPLKTLGSEGVTAGDASPLPNPDQHVTRAREAWATTKGTAA
ncbi:hypothetical protein GCM10027414_00740 [Humibacter ginsengiterrae]